MKTYYLPIKSTSLAHYFGCACIKAAKYFKNKPQDIQDMHKDFLLLTTKKGTTKVDCCLELVLTEDEINDMVDLRNGWYLLNTKPLPITRIKKIYFSNEEQKNLTITNITMSTAFVPNDLIDVCEFEDNRTDVIKVPSDCKVFDQTEKILQFDRFLGALALMRLVHEPYMNYSQNYIATLSFFNHIIEKQLENNKKCEYNYAFQGIFSGKGFEKVLHYLDHPINEDSLNSIAADNNQVIKKDKITRLIDVDSISDTWTYTIAVLNAYGVGEESRKKRVDGLIQSFFNSLREGKREGVALCYGYNRGYSVFSKSYGDVAFKYKLGSQLDYYTIESVYQYVFNNVISAELPYIDSWCPKQEIKKTKRNSDYAILDEIIIGKKKAKVFSQEWWNCFSQRFEKKFGSLADPIFALIKPSIENDIYLDIKEELEESSLEVKDENNALHLELNRLYKELEDYKEKNTKLQNELFRILNNQKSINSHSVVAEPNTSYCTTNDLTEIKLKNAIVNYKDLTIGELKRNIKAKDTFKLGDLLLSQTKDLFLK